MHRGNARNAYPYQGGTGDRQAPPVMGGPQRRQSVSRQHHPSLGVKACQASVEGQRAPPDVSRQRDEVPHKRGAISILVGDKARETGRG